MTDVLSRTVDRWRASGLARGPALSNALSDFQHRHSVVVPCAMQDLYLQSDGMEPGYPEDMIRFWPVAEWSPVKDHFPDAVRAGDAELVLFADYSIWAHAYAVRGDGAVFLVAGQAPIEIASSFETFLRHYLDEPRRLFGP